MSATAFLIRSYFDALNRQDWAGMLALVAEDVRHDINQGGIEWGRESFAKFLAHMDRCYAEQIGDLVVMADGQRAAAEFTVSGTYKQTDGSLPAASGQTYRLPAGSFFELRGGHITRVTTYYNLKDWLAQIAMP
jgi:steroid delta-isomerase-like uncharacterized protein